MCVTQFNVTMMGRLLRLVFAWNFIPFQVLIRSKNVAKTTHALTQSTTMTHNKCIVNTGPTNGYGQVAVYLITMDTQN